jgi:CheY-like chemotaxis protein
MANTLKKILVAEDEKFMQIILKQFFEQLGYEVTICKNGKVAADFLDSDNDIEMVITDYLMPEMNGDELIEYVRSDSRYVDIPIVVITGHGEEEIYKIEDKVAELGAVCIPKTLNREVMKEAIHKAKSIAHAHVFDG